MKQNENKSFEDALLRLEEIVHILENGNVGLDDSLQVFEEGIGLVKYCNEKLNAAEQRVRILLQNEEGEMTEKTFLPNDPS